MLYFSGEGHLVYLHWERTMRQSPRMVGYSFLIKIQLSIYFLINLTFKELIKEIISYDKSIIIIIKINNCDAHGASIVRIHS